MFMNERKSGTEHVTATLEAAGKAAIIGSKNVVFNCGDKFAATVTPATGEVAVSNGVMSWGGRISGIKNTESVSYSPPESETLYKKVVVCAQYQKNTETSIETIELAIFESDVQSSESAANALTVDTGASEITSATEVANFPLWTFVATSISATTPVQLFETVSNLSELDKEDVYIHSRIDYLAKVIQNDRTARDTQDSNLQLQINSLGKSVAAANANIDALSKKNIVLTRDTNGFSKYESTQPITQFTMFLLKYETVAAGTKYMPIPALTQNDIVSDTKTYVLSDKETVVTKGSLGAIAIDNYNITISVTVYANNFTISKSGSSEIKAVELIGIY